MRLGFLGCRSFTRWCCGLFLLASQAGATSSPAGASLAALSPTHSTGRQPLAATVIQVHENLRWTEVDGRVLLLDIYQPVSATPLPVVLMFHGGGWLINDKSIMQQSAAYLARHGGFVVVNTDYRLLGEQQNQIGLDQIVSDALGALVWVKQHIGRYGGDPNRLAVTGDSAGGHLAAMALLASRRLADTSAYIAPWPAFTPSYLPAGQRAYELATTDALRVQAAVLSYPVLDLEQRARRGFENASNGFWQWGNASARGLFGNKVNVWQHPLFYRAASPQHLLPAQREYRLAPQLIQVGMLDTTTPVSGAQRYVQALQQAGQPVTLQLYPGLGHAYLDNACPRSVGVCAQPRATAPLDEMIVFLRQVLSHSAPGSDRLHDQHVPSQLMQHFFRSITKQQATEATTADTTKHH